MSEEFRMNFLRPVLCAGALAIGLVASSAQAAFIEVHSELAYTAGGGESTGRGQGFEMLATQKVNSIGIQGNLRDLTHVIEIFSSTDGTTVGGLLASFSQRLGGSGFGWYDMSLNYTFDVGQFYVVNWRPETATDWVIQSGNVGNAGINYFRDGALPDTDGPFRLLQGFAGASPNPGNSLHPNMRYGVGGTVPLPASLPLLLGAVGAMGYFGRRRKI